MQTVHWPIAIENGQIMNRVKVRCLVNMSMLLSHLTVIGVNSIGKAGRYRDTVSVEPGSKPFYGSVSVSETHFFGIFHNKDTFFLY